LAGLSWPGGGGLGSVNAGGSRVCECPQADVMV
jgi:hypothetical protein